MIIPNVWAETVFLSVTIYLIFVFHISGGKYNEMDSNKKYIYTMLLQNSESYWKFLIGYLIMLLFLLTISEVCYEFSAAVIIMALMYIVSLWIATMYVMIFYLKKLLTENLLLNWKIFDSGEKSEVNIKQENENNLEKLLNLIQEQLINYWYNNISRDEKFPKGCEILIGSTLRHFNDTLHSTDKSCLTYVISSIFLRHLKEFRRTSKLKEKSGSQISELYRYSFAMMPTKKTREYYVHQITKNLLINFIHWELWNSIPCQLVVSIISNKLSNLIDVCANPEFINYYLLETCISKEQKMYLDLGKFSFVKIEIGPDKNGFRKKKTPYLLNDENQTLREILPESIENNEILDTFTQNEEGRATLSDCISGRKLPIETEMSTSIVNDVYAPYEESVKIHVPKSATKTWNEVLDLEISFGEDPLRGSVHDSSLADFVTFSTSEADMSPLNNNNKTLLEEMKHITSMEGLKITMKPFSDATANTLRDFKDFQENTVNTVMKPMSQATSQALHKIGDLQDEAAGVVEGLFDFGMAGIRKGLKLTGLQENSVQGNAPSDTRSKHMLNSPSITNKKSKKHLKDEVAEECIWVNPLQHNPNFDDDENEDPIKFDSTPSIIMDSSEYESPDPEYEEAADLASTIAKLRSLLQQRSESTATTPVASPMIVDDNKSVMDLSEADTLVPSFYKLAKTATGVFNNTLNTIKTALPVNGNEIVTYEIEKWDYEDSSDQEACLLSRMNKLVHDRKDFCMIEAAYDAFDSQQLPEDNKHISDFNYQDELDEFESRVPLAKTIIDIICELIVESDTLISQEPFIRFILAVFGQSFDNIISQKVEDFINTISITEIPTEKNNEVLTMELDVFVNYLTSAIPDALTFIIGQSTLQDALNLLVSSIQLRKCNEDIILQIFEFISLRLMEESSRKESVYST